MTYAPVRNDATHLSVQRIVDDILADEHLDDYLAFRLRVVRDLLPGLRRSAQAMPPVEALDQAEAEQLIGACGAITGIGNALPKEVLHLVDLCEKAAKGDATARRKALELEQALGVLSSFDEGVDLVLFYKYLMVLEGHAEYTLHFNANDALSPSQKRYVVDQHKLFKAWYASWWAA